MLVVCACVCVLPAIQPQRLLNRYRRRRRRCGLLLLPFVLVNEAVDVLEGLFERLFFWQKF
jgi:hypothetical protein